MPVIERAGRKATVAMPKRWEGACSWAKSGNLPECATSNNQFRYGNIANTNQEGNYRNASIQPGAACLAVALKTKNAERRALGLSSAFSDWVPGISEPGMYGITLKYKTPMIASMIGSGIGAFIGCLMNIGSYAGGPPNLFTLPLFINPATGDTTDLRNIVICMIIGGIITFVLTWILYKDSSADEIDAKG